MNLEFDFFYLLICYSRQYAITFTISQNGRVTSAPALKLILKLNPMDAPLPAD